MKKLLAGLVGSMLVASVGFAAPAVNLAQSETVIGYGYANPSVDVSGFGSTDLNSNDFYLKNAVTDKITLGVEYNNLSKSGEALKTTDLAAEYAVDKNFSIIAGNRNYDSAGATENKFLYGITAKTKLASQFTGYVSYLKTSEENEWVVGTTYDVTKNTFVDLSYINRDFSDLITVKGLQIGVGYKF